MPNSLDSGKCAIYLNYQKDFDSVPHSRLMTKLVGYGISGNLLEWIKQFSTLKVSIRRHLSRPAEIYSDVPQGSD